MEGRKEGRTEKEEGRTGKEGQGRRASSLWGQATRIQKNSSAKEVVGKAN